MMKNKELRKVFTKIDHLPKIFFCCN